MYRIVTSIAVIAIVGTLFLVFEPKSPIVQEVQSEQMPEIKIN